MSNNHPHTFYKRSTHSILLYIILSIMILCLNIFVGYTYKNIVVDKERDYAYKILKSDAKKQGTLINLKIENQYLTLELFAKIIAHDKDSLQSFFSNDLSFIEKTDFLHLFIADSTGFATGNTGKTVNVHDRSYFRESIAGHRSSAYIKNGYLSDEARLILSVPIIKDDTVIGVLYGSYNKQQFEILFENDDFEIKSYSFIIDKNGNSIIHPQSKDYLLGDDNIIEYLKNYRNNVEYLNNNIKNRQFGFIKYAIGAEKRYAIYSPIGKTDWILFTAVSDTVFEVKSQEIIDTAQYIFLFISIFSIILFGIIIILASNNNKKALAEQKKEKVNFERTRIAIENSYVTLWDYEFNSNSIIQTPSSMKIYGQSQIIHNVPEKFIEEGRYQTHEIQKVRDFYISLSSGVKTAEAIFYFKTYKNTWIYEHITYTVIFDNHGKPFKAIGVGRDVTAEYLAKQCYERELSLQKIMSKNTIKTALINITKRTLERVLYNNEYLTEQEKSSEETFDSFFDNIIKNIIDNDELKIFISDIYHGNGNKYIKSDNTIIEFEAYRYNQIKKEIQFVSMACSFLYEPTSHDLMAFLCTKDISKEKENLEILTTAAERDSMTHLYNHNTVFARIESYLVHEGGNGTHALFIIDLDNFKIINDTFGHPAGDTVLINTAEQIRALFRSDDIIGRIGGDEFIVLMKNVTIKNVTSKVKKLNQILHKDYFDHPSLTTSASVGVYVFCNKHTISGLYERADKALYLAKERGKDTFYIEYEPDLAQE